MLKKNKPKLKITENKIVKVQDWDRFIKEVYGRPYSFQQQNGCMERQTYYLFVPGPSSKEDSVYDFENQDVPEEVNHSKLGVAFQAWLARDPKQPLQGNSDEWALELWWYRNFYPSIDMVARDLCAKGLLKSGEYRIVIDW